MKRAFHHDRRGITIHFILAWLFFYVALHMGYLSYDTYRQNQRQQTILDSAMLRIDFYDHEAGDAVLVQLTSSMRSTLRDIDTFGRLGGEEFAAVLPGVGVITVMQVAERLRACVESNAIVTRTGTIRVTISIGVTLASGVDHDADALFRRADSAMYRAKNEGRNCIRTVLP